MGKACKAYVIDPEKHTVEQVEYSGDYRDIYKLGEFDCFDVARFNAKGDAAFVDDDGLLKNPTHFFLIAGYPQPLAGKGVVLGCDAEGESVAPSVSLEWLRSNVGWIERLAAGALAVEVPPHMIMEARSMFA